MATTLKDRVQSTGELFGIYDRMMTVLGPRHGNFTRGIFDVDSAFGEEDGRLVIDQFSVLSRPLRGLVEIEYQPSAAKLKISLSSFRDAHGSEYSLRFPTMPKLELPTPATKCTRFVIIASQPDKSLTFFGVDDTSDQGALAFDGLASEQSFGNEPLNLADLTYNVAAQTILSATVAQTLWTNAEGRVA